jgi:hypothetical protein
MREKRNQHSFVVGAIHFHSLFKLMWREVKKKIEGGKKEVMKKINLIHTEQWNASSFRGVSLMPCAFCFVGKHNVDYAGTMSL